MVQRYDLLTIFTLFQLYPQLVLRLLFTYDIRHKILGIFCLRFHYLLCSTSFFINFNPLLHIPLTSILLISNKVYIKIPSPFPHLSYRHLCKMVLDQTQRWACYCFLCLSEYGELPQRNTLCCHSKSFHHGSCYCAETLLSIRINCEVNDDWENNSRSLPANSPPTTIPQNKPFTVENDILLSGLVSVASVYIHDGNGVTLRNIW